MADGARFDIEIQAQSLGVDASTEQLDRLIANINLTSTVATQFDGAVAAASKQLQASAAAAQLASDALNVAQARYNELEKSANVAAKAVEKAAASGKPTEALAAAAESAAEKMREQAKAVAELEEKSRAASASQSKWAANLKTLQGQQATAVATIKRGNPAIEDSGKGANKAAGQWKALSGAASSYAVAAGAVTVAAAAAVVGLAAFAIASRPDAMAKLNMISQQFHLSLMGLFKGLRLDGFLEALHRMASLFDVSNTSGRALKFLIETILQPIFDGVAKAEPYVSEFFKGMIAGALDVVIAVLRIRNAFIKSLSPDTRANIKLITQSLFTMENAFKAGEIAVIAIGVAILPFAVAAGLVVVAIVAIVAALYGIYKFVADFGKIWDSFTGALADLWPNLKKSWLGGVQKIWDWLTGYFSKMGAAVRDAFAGGATADLSGVANAFKDVGNAAIKSTQTTLEIHSPSRVFRGLGEDTVAGYVEGVDDNAHSARDSIGAVVAPPAPSVSSSTSTSSTTSSSSKTVIIQSLVIGGGQVAASNWADFKRAVAEVLEGASVVIGGGETASA